MKNLILYHIFRYICANTRIDEPLRNTCLDILNFAGRIK